VTEALAIAVLALPLAGALLLALIRAPRPAARVNVGVACATAAPAFALALVALLGDGDQRGSWYVADAAGGLFLLVVATVGLLSALASPAYLRTAGAGLLGTRSSPRLYYTAFHLFWAALLAVPLVDNLGIAWLLVEATTGASALLVAYSGRPTALEAGWKYLVLTTVGLAVALLGIVVLYATLGGHAGSLSTLDWPAIHAAAGGLDRGAATLAAVLLFAGLAAKIGWAPVHNWLPDAHSEAPPAVSALLSAALLPTVMLVAWRVQQALAPSGASAGRTLFLAFGLASLAVAVPFLWRPLPLKRLLAYSSLEHMGVLALGIGFATPLALAGVVLHVAGHALAKALGFYATIPLTARHPALAWRPPVGLSSGSAGARALGLSLAALAGLPPSPLFCSELLIVAGGVAAGQLVVASIAAVLLALGFAGIAHAGIEALARTRRPSARRRDPRSPRLAALTAVVAVALLALSASAWALPGSALVAHLARGIA
jgi:hydrogenase-4 component F